jgi:hypothetical protein
VRGICSQKETGEEYVTEAERLRAMLALIDDRFQDVIVKLRRDSGSPVRVDRMDKERVGEKASAGK